MTVHDLHDALNLLPSDLITAADKVRTVPKAKIIPWKRIVPIAACLVLLLSAGLVMRQMGTGQDKMVTAEAPAAMAPLPENQKVTEDAAQPALPSDAAMPEVPAEEAAPKAPEEAGSASNSTAMGDDDKPVEEELCIDHSHRYAEKEETDEDVPSGFCGNLTVTITLAGESHSLTGADALTLTEILRELPYDRNAVCRCMAEFTVDTELLSGIQVNLTKAFARCDQGQAALSEKQVRLIQNVMDTLQ